MSAARSTIWEPAPQVPAPIREERYIPPPQQLETLPRQGLGQQQPPYGGNIEPWYETGGHRLTYGQEGAEPRASYDTGPRGRTDLAAEQYDSPGQDTSFLEEHLSILRNGTKPGTSYACTSQNVPPRSAHILIDRSGTSAVMCNVCPESIYRPEPELCL